jgi:hemerythrin-like domain-containing protein
MKNHERKNDKQGTVEGEGSYTGARRYNERLEQHIANNDPEKLAEEAKRALQGDEREVLEEAERRAKRGPSPKP